MKSYFSGKGQIFASFLFSFLLLWLNWAFSLPADQFVPSDDGWSLSFILFFSYFSPARRVQRGRMTALARVAFTHEPTRTFHFSYTIGARIKKSSGLLCRKQRPDSTAPFRRVQLVEIQKEKRERGNEPLLVRRVTNTHRHAAPIVQGGGVVEIDISIDLGHWPRRVTRCYSLPCLLYLVPLEEKKEKRNREWKYVR